MRSRLDACRNRRGQRGSVAVEFALVLPLLVMLLMGTITGGLAYFQKISIADAVREGARFGATADHNVVTNWSTKVRKRTVDAAPGVLNAGTICVQLINTSGAVVNTVGCDASVPVHAPPSSLVSACVVRVYASRTSEFSIGLAAWPVNLVQDSYARYEWSC